MKAITLLLLLFFLGALVSAQTTPPPPSAPRVVKFPTPVEKTLPNGLRVIVVERHNTPLATVALIIRNGGEVDPPELAGRADLTANLLTKGTATRSATRIADEVEGLGGMLDSAAQWDASTVSVGVMSDKLSAATAILADVVRRPTFKTEEIERLRLQYIDSITLAMDDPSSIARFVGAKVLYGDDLYGHPLTGTLESMKRIKRSDIVTFHRQFYRPDNAILVIGGDVTGAAGFSLATRFFGDWAKPKVGLPALPAAHKSDLAKETRVVVIDKSDAGQAAVFFVRRGIQRSDPDYYSGIVTNSVLSGYSGRLNQEIRIKRGLSYGASSSLEARRNTGPYVASAQTKNESGDEVAELLQGEVERLKTSPPVETELTPRKAVLIGDFSRSMESVDGLVTRLLRLALHNISLDEINRFIDNVQDVKTEDVQKFAGEKLDARSSAIIIVGNSRMFLSDLKKRYQNVEVVPFDELDLNTKELRKKKVAHH